MHTNKTQGCKTFTPPLNYRRGSGWHGAVALIGTRAVKGLAGHRIFGYLGCTGRTGRQAAAVRKRARKDDLYCLLPGRKQEGGG